MISIVYLIYIHQKNLRSESLSIPLDKDNQ